VDPTAEADKDIVMGDASWESGEISWWSQFEGQVEVKMDIEEFPFDDNSLDFRLNGTLLRDGRQVRSNELVLRACEPFAIFEFDNNLPEFQVLGLSVVEFINTWGVSSITFGVVEARD
jgi:hypothetical protein